jgi:hypothetical protein
MKRIPALLALCFTVFLLGFVIYQKGQKPRILVIHSYATDYVWVTDINIGLKRVFDRYPNTTIRYHYMDLQRHTSEAFQRTAKTATLQLIEQWKPDILIIMDDIAQRLVGMEFLNHKSIWIVFGGVNGEPRNYKYDQASNVTGILERKPMSAIKETLEIIARAQGFNLEDPNAKKPRVVFIGDMSAAITAEMPSYEKVDWRPLIWMPPMRAHTFDDWKAAVAKAADIADIVLVTNYRAVRLADGKTNVRPETVMGWTEQNSKIPVLGMNYFNVTDGATMAVAVSPYEQGEVAADMAMQIARGKSPKDIPIAATKQFVIAVRKSAMERRKLPIPSIYEAFARATDNYYE